MSRSMTKIRLSTKFAYGVGAIGESSVIWLFSTLAFFYFIQVTGLSATLAAVAAFIATIFAAISQATFSTTAR